MSEDTSVDGYSSPLKWQRRPDLHIMERVTSRSVGIVPGLKGYIHDDKNEENRKLLCRYHMQRLKSPLLIIYPHLVVFLNSVYVILIIGTSSQLL